MAVFGSGMTAGVILAICWRGTPPSLSRELGVHPSGAAPEGTGASRDGWIVWNRRGKICASRGDAQGALVAFDQAIALSVSRPVLYANRGGARLQMGDRPGAIGDCSRALEMDSKCVEAWINRAQARQETGEWAAAAGDYEKALELLEAGDWLREPVTQRRDEARRRSGSRQYY
jgi:tetratricopeptide (TPR) repeat protein